MEGLADVEGSHENLPNSDFYVRLGRDGHHWGLGSV